jgi:hypothetical protein
MALIASASPPAEAAKPCSFLEIASAARVIAVDVGLPLCGNCVLYLRAERVDLLVRPGVCPAKWLQGMSMISKPRS